MGDVSQLMPVIHPYVAAAIGDAHGNDYLVGDYELGVVTGAKAMAMTVIDLLADGGTRATEIRDSYRAPDDQGAVPVHDEGPRQGGDLP